MGKENRNPPHTVGQEHNAKLDAMIVQLERLNAAMTALVATVGQHAAEVATIAGRITAEPPAEDKTKKK